MEIIVLTNGFVFLGKMNKKDKNEYRVTEAWNIRRYGTTKGLSQIAIEGIQPETELDYAGELVVNPTHYLFSIKVIADIKL